MGFFSGRTKIEPSPLQVGSLEQVLFSPQMSKKVATASIDTKRPIVSQPLKGGNRGGFRQSVGNSILPSLGQEAQQTLSPWPIVSPNKEAHTRLNTTKQKQKNIMQNTHAGNFERFDGFP